MHEATGPDSLSSLIRSNEKSSVNHWLIPLSNPTSPEIDELFFTFGQIGESCWYCTYKVQIYQTLPRTLFQITFPVYMYLDVWCRVCVCVCVYRATGVYRPEIMHYYVCLIYPLTMQKA